MKPPAPVITASSFFIISAYFTAVRAPRAESALPADAEQALVTAPRWRLVAVRWCFSKYSTARCQQWVQRNGEPGCIGTAVGCNGTLQPNCSGRFRFQRVLEPQYRLGADHYGEWQQWATVGGITDAQFGKRIGADLCVCIFGSQMQPPTLCRWRSISMLSASYNKYTNV